MMDPVPLRLLIARKLEDGRLPHHNLPRVWGGPGAGEVCAACDEAIPTSQLLMEGIALDVGRHAVQFHVKCFYVWDEVRKEPGRSPRAGNRATGRHTGASPFSAFHAACCMARHGVGSHADETTMECAVPVG